MAAGAAVADLVTTVVVLLLVSAITLAVARRLKLPFTVMLVVVGMLLGLLAENGPTALRPLVEHDISPGVILFVFLPTLIFESAYNLDARLVRQNLAPILALAIPGLLLSTALIGLLVWMLTPIPLVPALLLGAILSATDPVAVVSLFRQLGAPQRLTVLVEGESLFNDATSIVLAGILAGFIVAGEISLDAVASGFVGFFGVFFGGVLIGWLMALLAATVIGRVRGDPLIEITLTTTLAYLSFLVAEEAFHVSGVMAVVAAGVTLGGWGRVKISPSVRHYLDHFWEYLAFVANALIFLLVGLRIELGALAGALDLLVWVVVAMLVSRAAVVYGLVPLLGRIPGAEPIGPRYRHVMWWGGLRGAIALAIVLSLPEFAEAETFVVLVTGAVLFTLLIPGLTIEHLVRRLGLDRPPLADRLARREGLLAAKQLVMERVPELRRGGLFSARIAEGLERRYRDGIAALHRELDALREAELDERAEQQLLFMRCLAMEKTHYLDGFGRGHLSERAYRDLAHSIDSQVDALRHHSKLPDYTLHPPHRTVTETLLRGVRHLFRFTELPEQWQAAQVAQEYEEAWGRYQGCLSVLGELDRVAAAESMRGESVEAVRGYYQQWVAAAERRIDSTAELFPEYVTTMQERLAGRLALFAEREAIEGEVRDGVLPEGIADELLEELSEALYGLRGGDVAKLHIAPDELLRKVPFFSGMQAVDFDRVASCLHAHTVPAGDAVIQQGDRGDAMYLIGRGVIRVSRSDAEGEHGLATLMAGDFFGEMALLNQAPRTATCRSVTPCALYELRRADFDAVCTRHPSIRAAVSAVERDRSEQLSGG